ncbi:MAG: winged helix-turn-helix transcriptional regulator [Candidatus Syntropharchaeia archaeon]
MDLTKKKILEVVYEEGEPMSIGEIAKKAEISWATAKTNILELSQENLLKIKKFGRNWIVWMDGSSKKTCATYRRV